jgi:uncharacterized YccA/Bax inhibitor family protein
MMIAMVFYILFLFVAVRAFHHGHPEGVSAYLLALLPALPVVGITVVVGMYLAEEKDEFLRNVFIESMLWGIGVTLSVTTVWGFLELFVPVPHLDLYFVFALFWVAVGIASPFLRLRYR